MAKPAKQKFSASPTPPPSAPTVEARPFEFSEGHRVVHPQFGNGSIVMVEPRRLTIAFKSVGTKIIAPGFVKRA